MQALNLGPVSDTIFNNVTTSGLAGATPSLAPSLAVQPSQNGTVLAQYQPSGTLIDGVDWSTNFRRAAGQHMSRPAMQVLTILREWVRNQLANTSVYGVQLAPGTYTVWCMARKQHCVQCWSPPV